MKGRIVNLQFKINFKIMLAVAYVVEALCYNPEGHGFDSL
jgi:hypothetical protein